MNIAVCVKQIPTAEAPVGFTADFRLRREGDPVLDDADAHGVELALRLAEAGGDEVVLLSMAPDGQTSGLRTALAMGAARAVVVSDPALSGADALSTAKVLAALARRLGVDLLVAATESSDGYTGTVPVQVAELLGWPAVTYATDARLGGGALSARCQSELGSDDVTCALPAVLSVTAAAIEPRYPSLRGIMAARQRPVETLDLAALGLDGSTVGGAGARQEVLSVEPAPPAVAGELVTEQAQALDAILGSLGRWKVL